MKKGLQTKNTILEIGLEMASQLGLECVTIGELAKQTQLSKSGLFAHFQSKENLQIEILKYAGDDFTENVIVPALKTTSGIRRIFVLIQNWIDWGEKLTGGCIFVTASTEYADRPGKVRDILLHQQQVWINCLERVAKSAVNVGEFRNDIDSSQFAFDFYSMLLGLHYYHKLLHDDKLKERQETATQELLQKYISPHIDLTKYSSQQ
ncbi:TetR/AcrR family transcriptional regulator [candidate division KSB1 bacterium]|nr:TetR/AcrR family transcriptional regulator [candidate division KSB1 bacterium]